MLDGFFNIMFWPMLQVPDPWKLMGIALFLTLVTTLIYKYTTDQKMMKALKDELKEMQKEMKNLKDNPKKAMEVQKKAMEKNFKYMMHSFKPMLITFIPLLFIFGWLRGHYVALGDPKVPLGLFSLGWIWAYIIFSIIFSIALRKVLKVY